MGETTKIGEFVMDEDTGNETVTLALPGCGLQKVTVNTSKIQDKSVAVRGIYEHAAALGSEFGPYCKMVLDSVIPLARFKFSSDLRATAAQTIAAVFEAACCNGESVGSMDLPLQYLPLVAQVLSGQIVEEDVSDQESLYAMSEALSDVYLSVSQRHQRVSAYSYSVACDVVKSCMKAVSACLERRAKVAAVLSGSEGFLSGEDERDELTHVLENEQELLTPLVDTVGYNLKFLRQNFVPIFESEVFPILSPYLQQAGYDIRARLSAVCLFDDCVEYCGTGAAAKVAPLLVGGAVAGMDDSLNGQDQELKRASIYGIAQLSRYAPSSCLAPYEDRIIPPLISIAGATKPSDDFDDLSLAIFENAVSALASLTVFTNAPFKSSRFIKHDIAVGIFLKNLPLCEDPDEAKFCNAALCDLVEKNSFPLHSECDQLYRIIGETLALVHEEYDLASEETIVRFAGILFRLYQEVDKNRTEFAFNSLSVDAQEAVQRAMGQVCTAN